MTPLQHDVVRLLPRLRRFARVLTPAPAAADDLVQAAVKRALASQDESAAPLDVWLLRTLTEVWLEAPRRPGPAPATRVERELLALPEEQRLAVALVLIEGLPYGAAAEVLGVSTGALSSRLMRGRAAMLARLEASP